MNKQEFKAKLSKIVCKPCEEFSDIDNRCVYCEYNESYEDCYMFNEVVEDLIAADIGDVSEYKHRAEVAKRALKNICKNIRIDSGDNEDEIKANSDILYKSYLKQAEKELKEEVK